MEVRAGRVTHYYNQIRVAVIELREPLQVGDEIHVRGRTTDFDQKVESMEIDHEQVEAVDAGAEVAVKVSERVRAGDAVFKVVGE